MKRALRTVSLLIALGATAAWLALGANPGWTRTTRPIKIVDEVTGIEGIEYRKSFAPGLELLGGALLGASLLGGASLLFRNQTNTKTHQ